MKSDTTDLQNILHRRHHITCDVPHVMYLFSSLASDGQDVKIEQEGCKNYYNIIFAQDMGMLPGGTSVHLNSINKRVMYYISAYRHATLRHIVKALLFKQTMSNTGQIVFI